MTILNTYVIENPTCLGIAMWVPVILTFAIAFWAGYNDTDELKFAIFIGLIGASGGAVIGCLLSCVFGPFTETVRHEVIFDEEIAIVEVMEEYDVVEQRGQIFVIEEKETE